MSFFNINDFLNIDELVYGPFPKESDKQFGYMEHHVTFHSNDGTELNGWFFNRGSNKPLVVWYGGKCAHIGHHLKDAASDTERSYLLMNYRGYGWSKGTPAEENMVADARLCIARCREITGGYSSLILAGASLGTGVAMQVAAAEHPDKLILVTPYDCIYHAAAHLVKQSAPFLPDFILYPALYPLVGEMLNSRRFAPQITCPVTIYFATGDTIIPHWSTQNLYNSFTSTQPHAIWLDSKHEDITRHPDFLPSFRDQLQQVHGEITAEKPAWKIGDDYYEGRNGYNKDAQKAFEYYQQAANDNHYLGYFNLGKCYMEGLGVPKDYEQAKKWFREAKSANPQYFWALLKLAELGDAVCMSEAADFYYNGHAQDQDCPHDPAKAFEWYLKSAEGGYHWGYFNVGKCYLEGQGVTKNDDEARKWFREAEEKGDNPWATYWLAKLGDAIAALRVSGYYATGSKSGWGMEKNPDKSEDFYTKAKNFIAEKHDALTALHASEYFATGSMADFGIPQDADKATEFRNKAREYAMESLVIPGDNYYYARNGCSQDYEKAFTYYMDAARCDHHWGYFNVGKMYQLGQGGVQANSDEAIKWLNKAYNLNPWNPETIDRLADLEAPIGMAERGDAMAALQVSEYYATGCMSDRGIPQDADKATEFRNKAKGFAISLVEKGDNYYHEKNGFSRDFEKAFKYYMDAATCGHMWGYFNIGRMYKNGEGVPQDELEALVWLLRAKKEDSGVFETLKMLAELGDPASMSETADRYYNGTADDSEGASSPKKAFYWYSKAAEGGYHWGYYNVGRCYMEGKGVAKNPDEARKWFRQAAMLGNSSAKDELRKLGDL